MRGGLSYAVIIVGAVLGAITGTVAASVIAMGLISLPVMMRYGYNVRHATGVIAASGTITQLIPPSLVLIVLADQLRQLARRHVYRRHRRLASSRCCCSAGWVFILSHHPAARCAGPAARSAHAARLAAAGQDASAAWCRRLALIFIVLGTIFLGLATPTEAGAMGVVGAMLLAWFNGRLTWR